MYFSVFILSNKGITAYFTASKVGIILPVKSKSKLINFFYILVLVIVNKNSFFF